jgi:hypothetical protein
MQKEQRLLPKVQKGKEEEKRQEEEEKVYLVDREGKRNAVDESITCIKEFILLFSLCWLALGEGDYSQNWKELRNRLFINVPPRSVGGLAIPIRLESRPRRNSQER